MWLFVDRTDISGEGLIWYKHHTQTLLLYNDKHLTSWTKSTQLGLLSVLNSWDWVKQTTVLFVFILYFLSLYLFLYCYHLSILVPIDLCTSTGTEPDLFGFIPCSSFLLSSHFTYWLQRQNHKLHKSPSHFSFVHPPTHTHFFSVSPASHAQPLPYYVFWCLPLSLVCLISFCTWTRLAKFKSPKSMAKGVHCHTAPEVPETPHQ